jgi:hypothetical protein
LKELAELNQQIATQTNSPLRQFSSSQHTTFWPAARIAPWVCLLMDAMYSTWHSDPVSGERITYSKIGLGPLDFIGKKNLR